MFSRKKHLPTHDLKSAATDTFERTQENVSNLPIMSVSLAFLLGAGVTALVGAACMAKEKTTA